MKNKKSRRTEGQTSRDNHTSGGYSRHVNGRHGQGKHKVERQPEAGISRHSQTGTEQSFCTRFESQENKKHRDIDKKSGGHCNRNTETETLPRATGRGETDRRDNAKQKEGGDFKRTWIYISDARSGSGQRRTSLDREKNTVKHLAKESVMESK